MIKKVSSFLFSFGLLVSSLSFATGTETSGGGGVAVCRDQNKKIASAEMLDLFEAQFRFNYVVSKSSTLSARDQLINVIKKIENPVFQKQVYQTAAQIINSVQFLPPGIGMAPTTDLGKEYAVIVPEGCVIEPVGFYESDGTLKISRSVYQALSETDKAAFFLHESIYKLSRDLAYSKDSSSSRQIVGSLFSTNLPKISNDLIQSSIFDTYTQYQYTIQINPFELINKMSNLNVLIETTTADSISVFCESKRNSSYQVVEKKTYAQFKFDIENCSSIRFHIDGDDNGLLKILNQAGQSIYSQNFVQPDKSAHPTWGVSYVIPVLHSYLVLPAIPTL